MDIAIIFGLLFFSLFLAYFYFSKDIIYFGVLGAIIMILVGANMAATGSIDQNYCFSDLTLKNESVINATTYKYTVTCKTSALSIDRDYMNGIGTILMLIGMGMGVSFGYDVNDRRKKQWMKNNAQ